jgi:dUTP pyrophosphatase
VKALVFNHNDEDFVIASGDCVAQLILECIVTPEVEIVEGDLDATDRGANGFGSTSVAKRLRVET